jgi:DNA polymerase-3 subunit alpha
VTIKLDLSCVKLSHIMLLKNLFERHRGSAPIEIEFATEARKVAILQIDSKWGVTPGAKFDEELKLFFSSQK